MLARRSYLSALALAAAACGREGAAPAAAAPAAAAAAPAPAADRPPAADSGFTPRGTATVRIAGLPGGDVAGDYPARSCADPMVRMGDVREGVVYEVTAGAHKIVVSDPGTPRPGPQQVATFTGGGGTTVFNVRRAADDNQSFLLDSDRPHAVTLGPGLKTAEANGTFLDIKDAQNTARYAVSVRFRCD